MIITIGKQLRTLISIALVTLLLVILLANISVFWNVDTNNCVGESSRSMGTITHETPFRQYFVPQREKLTFIEVRIATYVKENAKGVLQFCLLDSNGNIIKQSEVQIKDLESDAYYRFDTNVKLNPEKTYSFTLHATDTGWDKPPVIWVSTLSGQEETSLTLPGVSIYASYQTNARYGYSYFHAEAFAGCAALIMLCGLMIFFRGKMSKRAHKLAGLAAILATPVIIFFLVEALNENSAMDKQSKVYPLNFVLYLLIYLIVFVCINRLRVSMILTNTIIYLLAIVNYFKLQFRGEPLEPWDFFSAKTAMNVSSGYQLSLSIVLIYTFLFFLLLNLVTMKIRFSMTRIRSRVLLGAATSALSVFMVMSLFGTDRYAVAAFGFMEQIGITNNVWNQTSNYVENGLVVAFTMNAQYMNVDKPSHYSIRAVSDLQADMEYGSLENVITLPIQRSAEFALHQALPTEQPAPVEDNVPLVPVTQDTVVKPNIITIMCESYADLTTVGDFITNEEVTPFYDSVSENVIKGTLYVSTYGGGTANTEFEFLTGNSMAFLPNGSVPYQQYISSPTGSLAQILDSEGYSTIAVHPYIASGWNRTSVYSNFGFDQFLSVDDFITPKYVRGYVSDESSYDKLIELYESKPEGQPIFLFNVTMQNHGGYGKEYDNFEEQITLTEYPNEYPETEQYLSLLNESDAELEQLIQYFSQADEPTVICFFGDHLPNLKNDFYDTILGKDLSELSSEEMLDLYKTPFLIWANYDIPEQEIDMISANYLSTLLLQTANMDLPEYNQYISSIYPDFPVISGRTIIDANGIAYESISAVPNSEMINNYAILAYNNLFYKHNRNATLFDSVSPFTIQKGIMIRGRSLYGITTAPVLPESTVDPISTDDSNSTTSTDHPLT